MPEGARVRKNLRLSQAKLDRARRLLGTTTETETVERAEELIRFQSAFLPFARLHAVVAQELLAGAVNTKRGRQIHEFYIALFEARERVVTPSFRAGR